MLDAFLDELASPLPSPAGASAGAAAAAMAAALLTLAARVSDGWDGADHARARAGALRRRLVSLAREDVRVLSEARRRAGAGAEEAFSLAADVPLEIARVAAEAAELAALTAEQCKPSVRADAITAAVLAEAGCRAAAHIVAANLKTAPGDPRSALAEQAAAAAGAALRRVHAQARP